MEKIANANELQTELKALIAYAGSPNPSRAKLASDLNALAVRVAGFKKTPIKWKETEGKEGPEWVTSVVHSDSDGERWVWRIEEFKGPGIPLYRVLVKLPSKPELKWKKQVKSLSEAKKFAEKWINTPESASIDLTTDFVKA